MASDDGLRCPPWRYAHMEELPAAGSSILTYAAVVSARAERYRALMDERTDYVVCIQAASALAVATDALTTAISDAVASGDNLLS